MLGVTFGDATSRWFGESFMRPTPIQEQGWARIASGSHALLMAPTGSGKTLAAFLWAIDRCTRLDVGESPGVRVVYVSPLKALVYDVERNLRAPLAGIQRAGEALGEVLRPLEIDVRTGDTSPRDRQRMTRRPADILVTTPESLYLMLGSRARENFRTVEAIIVDEVHALAPSKRGAHLALSLERLAALAGRDPQRVGLSATVGGESGQLVAGFLGGDRVVEIVDASAPPALALEVRVPVEDMTRLREVADPDRGPQSGAQASIWPAVLPEVMRLIEAHRSTIVFTNSRGLCERLARQLNELGGAGELVRAHHGSISHARRTEIEGALKAGTLKGIVATSSLELGIDMGAVDLVVQIEAPTSVASGLQRVGRSGHQVGETSRAVIFPKFRGDLLVASVVARMMLDGALEPLTMVTQALDVLAQQIVAMVASEDREIPAMRRLIRRARPFRELSDGAIDGVLDMLSGRYSAAEFAELRPRLIWDREAGVLRARRGAKMLSLLNAGTIPDRGLYAVHIGADGPRIGELDEEMVFESRPGETFFLGASTWRIVEITRDRVIVEPAPGQMGRLPFWHGDGPGRPVETGHAIGAFLGEIAGREDAEEWLAREYPLDERARRNLLAYVQAQVEAAGVPTERQIVVERFRDEVGDWNVCILSPFGSRVHAPWALAIEAQLSRLSGYATQCMWTDDGIVVRLGDAEELPPVEALLPDPGTLRERVVEQLADSAVFAATFRECAARALLLPRRRPRGRTPLWVQRLRAQGLLAVAKRHPSFPIVLETYRECLQDRFDLPALASLLGQIERREVRVKAVETPRASPFARAILFSYVATYLYETDTPLAERRAQALALDQGLLAELLGEVRLRELLDPEAIARTEAELQGLSADRRVAHADALVDLLRWLGDLSTREIAARAETDPSQWLAELAADTRALEVEVGGERRWIAVEDAALYRDALGVDLPEGLPGVFLEESSGALEALVGRYARTHGPFTGEALAARMGLTRGAAEAALTLLEAREGVVQGAFTPGGRDEVPEWCAPDVLRRIKRRSLEALRAQIAPVPAEALGRFLPAWHGLMDRGLELEEALAQLEGVPLSFAELERRLLPGRVKGFRPAMLDELGARGAIVWVGRGRIGVKDGRVALYRRERVPLLVDPPEGMGALSEIQQAIVDHLGAQGASFFVELALAAGSPAQEAVLEALWDLVWRGAVTNDTFDPLRHLRALRSKRRSRTGMRVAGGRWGLVERLLVGKPSATARAHARAGMLLERYGIVSRAAAQADELPGGFAGIYPVLRAMEEAGRARRGYFIEAEAGLGGAQFALPGAVDRLRALRSAPEEPVVLALPAQDPANPWGALLPWPEGGGRRVEGAWVVLHDGALALFVEKGGRRIATFTASDEVLAAALGGLGAGLKAARGKDLRVEEVDGAPARRHAKLAVFLAAGFEPDHKGLTLPAR